MAPAMGDTTARLEIGPDAQPRLRAPSIADVAVPDHRQPLTTREAVLTPTNERIASVDALRGFAMFWILGGDALAWSLKEMSAGVGGLLSAATSYASEQLTHVPWEGVSFYDIIFPLFIFVVGVSIVFSLPQLVQHQGRAAAHWRILRRSLLLFALGIICYGGMSNEWPDIRLLGVLQRIALCYLFASLLFLNIGVRGLFVAFVALLVGYWAAMTFVPVPGIGAGSFEPNANLANWIDSQYLPGRKWEGTWDPEGLLSTLPAIATCLLGVFAGILMKDERIDPKQKTWWLIGAGVAMIAAGYLWSLQFPIIKNLWTSSYVLVTGGYSLVLLGIFHEVVDNWRQKNWATVFLWIGANAIALYMINNFASFEGVARRLVGGDVGAFFDRTVGDGAGQFLTAVGGLALACALAGFLYRRKIFLRV